VAASGGERLSGLPAMAGRGHAVCLECRFVSGDLPDPGFGAEDSIVLTRHPLGPNASRTLPRISLLMPLTEKPRGSARLRSLPGALHGGVGSSVRVVGRDATPSNQICAAATNATAEQSSAPCPACLSPPLQIRGYVAHGRVDPRYQGPDQTQTEQDTCHDPQIQIAFAQTQQLAEAVCGHGQSQNQSSP